MPIIQQGNFSPLTRLGYVIAAPFRNPGSS